MKLAATILGVLATALVVSCTRNSVTNSPLAASAVDAGTPPDGGNDDAEAGWQWATSLVKGLDAHPEPLAFPGESWTTTAHLTLWVDARYLWDGAPGRCMPLEAEAEHGRLHLYYAEKFGKTAGAREVPTTHLVLDEAASLQGGTVREADGRLWAYGCSGTLGALSETSPDALHYRATVVAPQFECRMTDLESDARCPRCVRCKPTLFYGRHPKPSDAPSLQVSEVDTAPTCIPCTTPDEGPALVRRLNHAVAGHFVRLPLDGPAFFRTSASCESDLAGRVRKRLVPLAHGCDGLITH